MSSLALAERVLILFDFQKLFLTLLKHLESALFSERWEEAVLLVGFECDFKIQLVMYL